MSFGEPIDAMALGGTGLVVLGIVILVATQPRGVRVITTVGARVPRAR